MLILTPDQIAAEGKTPSLNYVMGELARAFRPHRPRKADPESKRNLYTSLCRWACGWVRDFDDPRMAQAAAGKHERLAHGATDVDERDTPGGAYMGRCR